MATPTRAAKFRRWLLWSGTGLMFGVAATYLFRVPLTQAAVVAGLQRAGAGDIRLLVTEASPWALRLEKLTFRIRTQDFAAERVSLERDHWWRPTLGRVKIEGAALAVTVDGSDANPFAWTSYSGDSATTGGGVPTVPVDRLSIDGRLVLRTSAEEKPLTFTFQAEPGTSLQEWQGALQAEGPGLNLAGTGRFDLRSGGWEFKTQQVSAELAPWSDFLQKLTVVPLGPWTLAGRLQAEIQASNQGGQTRVAGRVELVNASVKNAAGTIEATGIATQLEFSDLAKVVSAAPGPLTVTALRTGKLLCEDLAASISFPDAEHLQVHSAGVRLLGGTVSAEPFVVSLGRNELEAVLQANGLDIERIMALTSDLPAQASGRVDGRLPLRLDEHGLRLGTGWLELRKGVYAELQLKAAGLLTGGMSPKDTTFVLMKRIEDGLLQLKLGALRLDIRPPDAPRGRSARLHLEGEPTDPNVKVPVVLDVNVNGPLEQLLNFGFNQNLSFGTGK